MLLGFALTEHCNLRCPHCIRDDVTTVRSLDAALIESIVDQAVELYGSVTASFTGGEPLLHPEFHRIVAACAARDRKSTRLNSSHSQISYAVFCLKKKNNRCTNTLPHLTILALSS